MATEMDMDPFEGLRVRPHIAYQNAAVSACKRLGLTAEQLDAGVIERLVEAAKKRLGMGHDYCCDYVLNDDPCDCGDEELESALRPFENTVRSDGNGGTR